MLKIPFQLKFSKYSYSLITRIIDILDQRIQKNAIKIKLIKH